MVSRKWVSVWCALALFFFTLEGVSHASRCGFRRFETEAIRKSREAQGAKVRVQQGVSRTFGLDPSKMPDHYLTPAAVTGMERMNSLAGVIIDLLRHQFRESGLPEIFRFKFYEGKRTQASALSALREVNGPMAWLSEMSRLDAAVLFHEMGHVIFHTAMKEYSARKEGRDRTWDFEEIFPPEIFELARLQDTIRAESEGILRTATRLEDLTEARADRLARLQIQARDVQREISARLEEIDVSHEAYDLYRRSVAYQEVFGDFLAVIATGDPKVMRPLFKNTTPDYYIRDFTFSRVRQLIRENPGLLEHLQKDPHVELYEARRILYKKYYEDTGVKPAQNEKYDALVARVVFESMVDVLLGLPRIYEEVKRPDTPPELVMEAVLKYVRKTIEDKMESKEAEFIVELASIIGMEEALKHSGVIQKMIDRLSETVPASYLRRFLESREEEVRARRLERERREQEALREAEEQARIRRSIEAAARRAEEAERRRQLEREAEQALEELEVEIEVDANGNQYQREKRRQRVRERERYREH